MSLVPQYDSDNSGSSSGGEEEVVKTGLSTSSISTDAMQLRETARVSSSPKRKKVAFNPLKFAGVDVNKLAEDEEKDRKRKREEVESLRAKRAGNRCALIDLLPAPKRTARVEVAVAKKEATESASGKSVGSSLGGGGVGALGSGYGIDGGGSRIAVPKRSEVISAPEVATPTPTAQRTTPLSSNGKNVTASSAGTLGRISVNSAPDVQAEAADGASHNAREGSSTTNPADLGDAPLDFAGGPAPTARVHHPVAPHQHGAQATECYQQQQPRGPPTQDVRYGHYAAYGDAVQSQSGVPGLGYADGSITSSLQTSASRRERERMELTLLQGAAEVTSVDASAFQTSQLEWAETPAGYQSTTSKKNRPSKGRHNQLSYLAWDMQQKAPQLEAKRAESAHKQKVASQRYGF